MKQVGSTYGAAAIVPIIVASTGISVGVVSAAINLVLKL
jgi:hypothetical protein